VFLSWGGYEVRDADYAPVAEPVDGNAIRIPETVDRPTSHMDWAPTLLTDALGCTSPIDRYSTGTPLFDLDSDDRVLPIEQWTQRAVRTRDRVYVFLSWGGYEVRDADYAPVAEPVDGNAIRIGFEQLSRFMRR
jgi:membrane-anchored protein YejM (alkaline phosphatase superfamily)